VGESKHDTAFEGRGFTADLDGSDGSGCDVVAGSEVVALYE